MNKKRSSSCIGFSAGIALSLAGLFFPGSAHAAVTVATLNPTNIPFETIPSSNTTINFTIDAGGSIQIDIEAVSTGEQIAGIARAGLAPGSYSVLWDALWPLGNDLGRKDGLYRVTVTEGSSVFVIGTFLNITSVDIHNVDVTSSFDGQTPAFPFIITYSLAKVSTVTIEVKNSSGTVVRTLASNATQPAESTAIPTLTTTWDGLDNNNRPVSLGAYTVEIQAKDPNSSDLAITRTRNIAVQSLASLTSNLQKTFEDNTFVYPNPVRHGSATFQALAVRNNANITVKIYTLAGDLVREERFNNLETATLATFNWDATNQAGKKVGRGLYYFVVREEDPQGTLQTVKKVAVIP